MSTLDNGTANARGGVKTLAIRLEPELHAQLALVAQLRSSTITDEIRTAIEAHIARAVADPGFTAQATDVLADIEREADARRAAISNLISRSGDSNPATSESTPAGTPAKARRDSTGTS